MTNEKDTSSKQVQALMSGSTYVREIAPPSLTLFARRSIAIDAPHQLRALRACPPRPLSIDRAA